jgi:hypothetical protein
MRLLQYSESGELSIHSFDDSAILSHMWEADAEDVTFADLVTGDGKASMATRRSASAENKHSKMT